MSFDGVLRIHQQTNVLARSLLRQSPFEDVHVLIPDPNSPELAFIRAISWLYCLYYEAGHVSFSFLRNLANAHSIGNTDNRSQHFGSVRCLRTEQHHNLGLAPSDVETRTAAESWRRAACGTAVPTSDVEWRACYERVIEDACLFLTSMHRTVRLIEDSEEKIRGQYLGEWIRRLNRHYPGFLFDRLVDDAKYRLGQDALDTVVFRNRHIAKWRSHLDLLEDGFDFGAEATRLIEKTLLEDNAIVLPVGGQDVMQALGIGPGQQVGQYLEEARRYFETRACGREELIDHLRSCHSKSVEGSTGGPDSARAAD